MINLVKQKIGNISLRAFVAYSLAVTLVAVPVFVFAADPQLVDGSKPASFYTWTEFINMLQRVASFMIKLAVAFAAFMFMWAGWKYVTAGGDEGKIREAHRIFKAVGIGIGLAAGAFLIVEVLIQAVGGEGAVKDWIQIR